MKQYKITVSRPDKVFLTELYPKSKDGEREVKKRVARLKMEFEQPKDISPNCRIIISVSVIKVD